MTEIKITIENPRNEVVKVLITKLNNPGRTDLENLIAIDLYELLLTYLATKNPTILQQVIRDE